MTSEAVEGVGQIAVGGRGQGPDARRPFDQFGAKPQLAVLQTGDALQVQGVEVIRIGGQDRVVAQARLIQPARLMQG